MSLFNKNWFDIVSIFCREGDSAQISIHAHKQPWTCVQFFIPAEDLQSPTFWKDIHDKAVELWVKPVELTAAKPCPRCGTNRRNWQRYYQGRSFCGFCGLDIPAKKGVKGADFV
jgi:hypothetical protein